MPNTSKTQKTRLILVTLTLLTNIEVINAQSNTPPAREKHTDTYDKIIVKKSHIKIKYSKKSRTIWLEDEKKSFHTLVKKLNTNTNPEKVGSDISIRFTSREAYIDKSTRYFGVTFAERSQQGDGSGQCGSGTEEYFVAYKQVNKAAPKEIFRKLISSCNESMELDYGDGNNSDFSVTSDEGEVTFRWLTFPGTDLYRIGRYSYLLNNITYQDLDRSTVMPIGH